MPYIPVEQRERLMKSLCSISEDIGKQCTPGELNYIVTMICQSYLKARGKNYTHINDIIGVLTNVILEFNRRVTANYEQGKIESNGDVYGD